MFIMYVDESGDPGLPPPYGKSTTRYFCLSGLIVHELRWSDCLRDLVQFRHWIKHRYGVYLDDELHSAELLMNQRKLPPRLRSLTKYQRLAIVRHHADQLARMPDLRIVNVVLDKAPGRDSDSKGVFRRAWYALFQRFENTILHRNFPGSNNQQDRGIVFPDSTNARVLRSHLDAMRMRNPLFIRRHSGQYDKIDEPIRLLIEDPICRDSKDSYFVQAVDCAAFLLKQSIDPSPYMKTSGGSAYFNKRLAPVLCREACMSDPEGVVRL